MFKKVIITILLVVMCAVFGFAQDGTYTTNGYFYMPLYGAYGTDEFDEYNAYMEIADNQIEANKVMGEASVDTSGTPVANDIPRFTDANTIEGLSYAELKAVLDLEIGTDVQAYDAGLLSIAGLTTAANDMIYTTALDTYAIMDTFAELQAVVADKTLVNEEDVFTIDANWVNTANPWADNEVVDDLTITAADTTDTTSFVALWETITGAQKLKSDAALKYNAGTGMLGANNVFFGTFAESDAPDANDDVDGGYVVGSWWIDTTANEAYICLDNSDGAAVWSKAAPGGGGGSVDTSGTPAQYDFAKFTDPDTIEGRSYSETRNDLENYIIYPQDYATGAGTSGDPWTGNCLDDAYNAASAGDIIYLRPGYYQLDVAVDVDTAGVSFIGAGIGSTIVKTADASGFIVTVDNVTIRGMTVDGTAQTAGSIPILNIHDCDYITVENVEVKEGIFSGITPANMHYSLFQNLYLHNNDDHGIHPGDTTGSSVKSTHNTYQNIWAWENGDSGFDDKGVDTVNRPYYSYNTYDNIWCWDNVSHQFTVAYQRGISVSNIFAWSTLGTSGDGDGIWLRELHDSTLSNLVSRNNYSTSTTGFGIRMSDSDNVNFINCIADNNEDAGIRIYNSTNITLTNCQATDSRTLTGIDIAFVDGSAGEDTITITDARFLEVGFWAGEDITVSGSTDNDGVYTIVSVVAGTINVATGELTAEAAGDTVTITQEKMQPYGLAIEASSDNVLLVNCDFIGNLTGNVYIDSSTNIYQNEGLDDIDFAFGEDNDWLVQYDESVDDQLLFTTTGTTAGADTDAMFEIITGASMDADQQCFGVSKGTQASKTQLFWVDEDGDAYFLGALTVTSSITTPIIYGDGSTYLRIGDAATTQRSLSSEDDLMVTGKFEANSYAHFGSHLYLYDNLYFNGTWSQIYLGSGEECMFRFNKSQTNDCLTFSLDNASKNIVYVIKDATAYNYTTPNSADPTLWLYSATRSETATTQWISATHNQTDGVITTGLGDIILDPAGLDVAIDAPTDNDPGLILSENGTTKWHFYNDNADDNLQVYSTTNLRYEFGTDGTANADVAWGTFSPDVQGEGKELLNIALEDANKPVKPYIGIPVVRKDDELFNVIKEEYEYQTQKQDDKGNLIFDKDDKPVMVKSTGIREIKVPRDRLPNEFKTQAEVGVEFNKYHKVPAKISIANAKYLEYLTGIIDELEVRIEELEKPIGLIRRR